MQPTDIRTFARGQIHERLNELARRIQNGSARLDADAVHDIRIAVRRFMQSLDVFSSLLPREGRTRIRARLRKLMKDSGKIRDRDIALEFLEAAGVGKRSALYKHLQQDRRRARKALGRRVKRWRKREFAEEWRAALELRTP